MIDARKLDEPDPTFVELRAQLSHDERPEEIIDELRVRVGGLPRILSEPEPLVRVDRYNLSGTVISVRVHCRREDYWQVFLAVGNAIGTRVMPPRRRRRWSLG